MRAVTPRAFGEVVGYDIHATHKGGRKLRAPLLWDNEKQRGAALAAIKRHRQNWPGYTFALMARDTCNQKRQVEG